MAQSVSTEPVAPADLSVGKPQDFPEWVPPIVVKELRQGLRSQGFVLILCLLHLMMLGVFLINIEFDKPSQPLDVPEKIFWVFFSILLLGVTPLRGLWEIPSEQQTRTLELLSAVGVSGTRLVVGKWGSLMAQSGLITLTLLPYFVLQYFGGGVDLIYSLKIMLLGILLSSVCTAAAMAFSGLKLVMRMVWMGTVVLANLLLMIFELNGVFEEAWFSSIIQSWGREWWLMGFAGVWATGVFLRLSGDTLDMPAANGAFWTRLGVCAGWIVFGLSVALGLNPDARFGYLILLLALTCVVLFWHLQAHRPILPVNLEPFRKWGGIAGRMGAIFLLPTWVGAVFLALLLPAGLWVYVRNEPGPGADPIAVGKLLHPISFFLCFVLLWRLFFARSRDAHGQVRERDPRLILGWAVGLSLLVSFVPKLLGLGTGLRPVGIYFPLFLPWAYSLKDSRRVALVEGADFLRHSLIAFSLYLVAVALAGVLWMTRKKVWKDFWSGGSNATSRSRMEEGKTENGKTSRPWSDAVRGQTTDRTAGVGEGPSE
jgi:hypothetical protein